jgi:hypothetical protein
MARIAVGMPIYDRLPPGTDTDYMRMWYSFGRRYPEHEFFLITRRKSEQFRARNAIVETALAQGCDYLLMLDDDHVFAWSETPESSPYNFLKTLLAHDKDIVGCLYYHRTGEYRPVLMKEVEPGAYTFLKDSDITGKLQEVDVQGGGCMLINMRIFDKILPPYFEPEMMTGKLGYGTDIQLCRKAKEAGFSVWCDTSIIVGHVSSEPEVITHLNRDSHIAGNMSRGKVTEDWILDNWLKGYRDDIREYTGLTDEEIVEHAIQYNEKNFFRFNDFDNPDDYYKSLGVEQLCRQMLYHGNRDMAYDGISLIKQFKPGARGYGLDFGCGSAPVGYEVLKLGHQMDFVDIDGTPAYEFLKWRVDKNGIGENAGWEIKGPYDFVIMLDSIEHLKEWESILDNIIGRMKEGAVLLTNYFSNKDFSNAEHINMNHQAVMDFLISRHMVPRSMSQWFKDDNYMGGAMNTKTEIKE